MSSDLRPISSDARGRWNNAWIAALVAMLCFANSLFNDFAYDDQYIIRNNPNIHSLANFRAIWLTDWWYFAGSEDGLTPDLRDPARDRLYRPLTVFTFALNYAVHGLRPLGYHAVNVLLHALVTFLVWHFAERLLRQPRIATIAALLFAVHPIHAEAVANVVGRAELLAAIFLLLGLQALLPKSGLPDFARVLAAGLAGFAAILAKETAICFPVLAGIVLWWRSRESAAKAGNARLWMVAAVAVLLPLGVYFVLRNIALGGHLMRTSPPSWLFNPLVDAETVGRIILPFTVLGHYARLIVAPIWLSCDYGLAIVSPTVLITSELPLGLIAAAVVMYGLIRLRGRAGGVLALLFLASYVLISNTVLLIGVSLAERLFYWPSVFVLLALAAGIHALVERAVAREPRQLRLLIILGVAGLVAFGLRSVTRSADWTDDLTLFGVDAEAWPNGVQLQQAHARNLLALANQLDSGEHRSSQIRHAEQLLDRALRVAPRNSTAIRLRGLAYAMGGDKAAAIRAFEQALALDPTDRYSRSRLDQLLTGGQSVARAKALEQAAATRPTDVDVWLELIQACVAAGDNSAALRHAEAARVRFPENTLLLRAYGEVLAINKQRDAAISALRELVQRDPMDWAAHINLTGLLAEAEPAAALEHAQAAQRLRPDDIRSDINLAGALALNKRTKDALDRYRAILRRLPKDDPQKLLIESRIKELAAEIP